MTDMVQFRNSSEASVRAESSVQRKAWYAEYIRGVVAKVGNSPTMEVVIGLRSVWGPAMLQLEQWLESWTFLFGVPISGRYNNEIAKEFIAKDTTHTGRTVTTHVASASQKIFYFDFPEPRMGSRDSLIQRPQDYSFYYPVNLVGCSSPPNRKNSLGNFPRNTRQIDDHTKRENSRGNVLRNTRQIDDNNSNLAPRSLDAF